jgi:hypothetical protein
MKVLAEQQDNHFLHIVYPPLECKNQEGELSPSIKKDAVFHSGACRIEEVCIAEEQTFFTYVQCNIINSSVYRRHTYSLNIQARS